MTQTSHYSLSWNEHLNTISSGLSTLQQNEEFVDMTLAADGYFVKVHKVIMALASPYIKEIISSMKCEHPVIYLNRVSYKTLSALLEYIYTGEVFVPIDSINEFIVAAKDLHIQGLQNLNIESEPESNKQPTNTMSSMYCNKNDQDFNNKKDNIDSDLELSVQELHKCVNEISSKVDIDCEDSSPSLPTLHYTVSNRGSLQMIVNRFMYYLKHSNKDNSRQWRCVDYLNNKKCPALIFTKGDAVLQRIGVHNHSMHDDKIFKKFKSGSVYTAIRDAIDQGLDFSKMKKEESLRSN